MGGVEPAYTFVKAMLEAGKHVYGTICYDKSSFWISYEQCNDHRYNGDVYKRQDKDRICGSVMHQHGLQWNIRDITLCGDGVTGGTFKKICIILKFFRTLTVDS